jgi:uncharacterized protein YjbJ (UPF0337 family)
MNADIFKGKWSQLKGSVKQQWGKLTDDDLAYIDGSADRLKGRIQERYGMAKDDVEREASDWYQRQN